VEPFTIVDDPCAWRAADWAGREAEWALELTPAELADLDAAVRAVEADPRLRLEVRHLGRPSARCQSAGCSWHTRVPPCSLDSIEAEQAACVRP